MRKTSNKFCVEEDISAEEETLRKKYSLNTKISQKNYIKSIQKSI